MKTTRTIRGAQQVARAFRRHAREVSRAADSILKQSARELCYQYGRSTDPRDEGGDAARNGFAKRIESDIAAVFPTRDSPAKIYRMLQAHAPQFAKAYWHAHKSGKHAKAAAILRKASLPQGGATAGVLKQYRTAKRGRVDRRKGSAAVVRRPEQARLVREQQGKIGVGKAAWHQAGKALGGRIRRNLTGPNGRATEEKFPAYVRKVSRKFSGLGGALVGSGRVTVWSTVKHGAEALDARSKSGAEAVARENFERAMAKEVEALNARIFNKTAA